jgi:7-cyano-7-deazaguanine synthase
MSTEAVLLSGGIDSAAIAYWRRPSLGIFVDYGQRSAIAEQKAATAVADVLGISLATIRADLSALGQGNMAGKANLEVATSPEWWPFRNQMLITFAAMKMIGTGHSVLAIGTVAGDETHRDGSVEFIENMDRLLALQEGGIRVIAPARKFTTTQLVREAQAPLEYLAWTHSCHVSDFPCGVCRGCRKHISVLQELGYVS